MLRDWAHRAIPYVMMELMLPGGTLIVLALLLYKFGRFARLRELASARFRAAQRDARLQPASVLEGRVDAA
jgi:hypothetical protein